MLLRLALRRWAFTFALIVGVSEACRLSTEAGPVELVVSPADTTVVVGRGYPLRIRVLDASGQEVPR
jgi:hypothetical protein